MTERLDIPVHGPYHHPLGPDPIPGGFAVREIKVFEDIVPVIAGDGAYIFEIPEDLHESMLVKAEAYVTTPSSSVAVQIQLRKLPQGLGGGSDMLSTKINIDPNEHNSKDAALQPQVIFPNELSWGDHIAIDVDNAGVGAKGLGVIVVCAPLHLASIALKGLKGDPGGVTSWQGQWANATGYTVGQAVSSGGSSYVAITNHTSSPATEPGVGASWQDAWMLLASGQQFTTVQVFIESTETPIAVGIKALAYLTFPCTIVEATMLADTLGSAVVDIWKDSYGNHPPTDADSITSSSPPTLVNANKSTDTALAGWTVGIAAGDVLVFNVDSVTDTIHKLAVALKVRRT